MVACSSIQLTGGPRMSIQMWIIRQNNCRVGTTSWMERSSRIEDGRPEGKGRERSRLSASGTT